MSHIAIITEKSTVAEVIAKAMNWAKTRDGFEGTFEGKKVVMQWARGHLLTLQDPEEVNPELGWNNPHALAPLPRDVKVVPIIEKPSSSSPGRELSQDRLKKAVSALKGASEVILATDPDREGEYIGWSILEHGGFKGKIRRLWLAEGVDTASIQKAMGKLLPASDRKSMGRAAEARARCDWAYMYLVRLMTYYGRHGVLGDHLGRGRGRDSVVSTGRVQSSALYMIYRLELAIENFVPRTFYNVLGDFGVMGVGLEAEYVPRVTHELINSKPQGVEWEPQGLPGENKLEKPLFTDKALVDQFKKRLLDNSDKVIVSSYKEGTRERHPPITYDLVGIKADVVKACKVSGDVAQAVIEDLYEQGFTSYPRTAHGELPHSMYEPSERDGRLKNISSISSLAAPALKAIDIHTGKDSQYKAFKPKSFVSKKLEHHGIIPSESRVDDRILSTMTPRKRVNNKLMHTSEHMQTAYKLIATRFVQAMLPPAKIATQSIVFKAAVEDLLGAKESYFQAKAERTVDPGYLAFIGTNNLKHSELPKLSNGTPATVNGVTLKSGKTKQPSRYSEINFEKAMTNAAREVDDPELRKYLADGVNKPEGIGTPASRKDIVPTLVARGYISVDKKDLYYLEPKGREYIEFQAKHGKHWLYKIETTAEWEGKLADLAAIEDDDDAIRFRDQFIEDTLGNIEDYIHWMNQMFSNQELKPLARAPAKVSDRMKAAIKSIAQRKGISLPKGILSDPQKASDFLNEHAAPSAKADENGVYPPSDAQLGLLAKIEQAAGLEASEEVKADRKLTSAFIEEHKPKLDKVMKSMPPSEKQISFAKSLASKLPADQQPPASVFENVAECRAFIDQQLKKNKKK